MQVNDILQVRWVDSGLGCADFTEKDAVNAELVTVTSYGRLAAIDSRRLVIEHEVGRGDVGHYTVILRGCLVDYVTLRAGKPQKDSRGKAKGNGKGKRARLPAVGVVLGWEGEDSAPCHDTSDTWH